MGIAVNSETIKFLKLRRNYLNLEISELENRKQVGVWSQADAVFEKNSKIDKAKRYFQNVYNKEYGIGTKHEVKESKRDYISYEEMPDFEKEIDRITAEYQDYIDELSAWEDDIDAQITTDDAERQEVTAYLDSWKQMLSTNIQSDFSFGLDG